MAIAYSGHRSRLVVLDKQNPWPMRVSQESGVLPIVCDQALGVHSNCYIWRDRSPTVDGMFGSVVQSKPPRYFTIYLVQHDSNGPYLVIS